MVVHQDLLKKLFAELYCFKDPQHPYEGTGKGHEQGVGHVEGTHDNEECFEDGLGGMEFVDSLAVLKHVDSTCK